MAVTGTSTTSSAATKSAVQSLITKLGTGSGVDLSSLAQNLVDAEKAPRAQAINDKISKSESRISGYSAMLMSISTIKASFESLQKPSTVSTVSAISNLPSQVGVSVTSGAEPGLHEVDVLERAIGQRSVSTRFEKTDTTLNNGTAFVVRLNINGEWKGVKIGALSTTPAGMVTAINKAKLGVTAQLVNTNDGSAAPYQIVLTGATGKKNAFSMTTDDGTGVPEQQKLTFGPAVTTGTLKVAGLSVAVSAGDSATTVAAKVKSALDADAQAKNNTSRIFTDNLDGTLTVSFGETEGNVALLSVADDATSPTGANPSVATVREFVAGNPLTSTGIVKQQALAFDAATDDDTVSVDGVSIAVTDGETGTSIAGRLKTALEQNNPVAGRSYSVDADGRLIINYALSEGDGSASVLSTGSFVTSTATTLQNYVAVNSPVTIDFSTRLQSSADAKLNVDGVTIYRDSNTISDAISGVTLNLLDKTTLGSPAVITVNRDNSALKDKVKALVDSFNNAMADFAILTGPKNTKDETDIYSGSLQNDSTVQLVKSQIRNMFLSDSSTPGTQVKALRDLGVSIKKDGTLEFVEATFDNTVDNNFDQVVTMFTANSESKSLFTTIPQGLAGDAVKRLTDMAKATGYIQSQSTSAQKDVDRYKVQLEALNNRMTKLLDRYTKTFATLDSFVGSANSIKSSLKSTFDAMNKSNN